MIFTKNLFSECCEDPRKTSVWIFVLLNVESFLQSSTKHWGSEYLESRLVNVLLRWFLRTQSSTNTNPLQPLVTDASVVRDLEEENISDESRKYLSTTWLKIFQLWQVYLNWYKNGNWLVLNYELIWKMTPEWYFTWTWRGQRPTSGKSRFGSRCFWMKPRR